MLLSPSSASFKLPVLPDTGNFLCWETHSNVGYNIEPLTYSLRMLPLRKFPQAALLDVFCFGAILSPVSLLLSEWPYFLVTILWFTVNEQHAATCSLNSPILPLPWRLREKPIVELQSRLAPHDKPTRDPG